MKPPCYCLICPACRTDKHVSSLWTHRQGNKPKPFARFWTVEQFCTRCGSHWLTWHWLEQLTGITVHRHLAVNPGRLSPDQLGELTVLRRQWREVQGAER